MRTIAIPFIRGGYLDFWKIVRMDDSLYAKAISNPNIVRLDGKTKDVIESILKKERTRLIRERWTIAKAKASVKLYQVEKEYWKELAKSKTKQGTIVL